MDITEAVILQKLYFPGISNVIQKEVTNFDTCQRTERPNIKYGKLPAKEAEEISQNKFCVYIIGTYATRRKGQTYNLITKPVFITYTVK